MHELGIAQEIIDLMTEHERCAQPASGLRVIRGAREKPSSNRASPGGIPCF